MADASRYSEEDLMAAVDAGAEDLTLDEDLFEVVSAPEHFTAVRDALTEAGVELDSAELVMRPTTRTPVEEADARALMRLVDQLEDHDDVQAVHANFDIDAELLERAAGAV